MKIKILIVFGTRPEAIKMAVLVKELKSKTDFEVDVCVTAQHREMLDQVLNLFEIEPNYDLNIMEKGQDLFDITTKVLLGVRDVLNSKAYDLVLVHGDTTTSMAASMAAFYFKVTVGHIEAGLRTNNIHSPWPEEMNRQITSRIARFHFAPTPLSKQNLLNENVDERRIAITGNTVIDSLQWVVKKIKNDGLIKQKIQLELNKQGLNQKHLDNWREQKRKMVLITGHRRENFGKGFHNICQAVKELAETYPEVDFVYPVHLNPHVRNSLRLVFGDHFMDQSFSNTFFIDPLDYLPFIYLLEQSYLVLTDSGGIQEEAPSLGKPVLVMRDTTERPEAVEAGTVKLVGTEIKKITSSIGELLKDKMLYQKMSKAINPYGDGKAVTRIIDILKIQPF